MNMQRVIGPNPQIAAATANGAQNKIPFFVTPDGPVREARSPFVVVNGALTRTPDGGAHDLFTIAGRSDAGGCTLVQPNFEQMRDLGNLIFRIPTPLYDSGLIENIADATILANMHANASLKQQLGIAGHPNTSGNDGTTTRFGWKAQDKSLEIFAAEAYNVEMGITSELFPNERGAVPISCQLNPTPENHINFDQSGTAIVSDIVGFADFMRFLSPPAPSPQGNSRQSQRRFDPERPGALQQDSLRHVPHALADYLAVRPVCCSRQPNRLSVIRFAGSLFFLHDGRATPANGGLLRAIQEHASSGSEANADINLFNSTLSDSEKPDLLNFLRSL